MGRKRKIIFISFAFTLAYFFFSYFMIAYYFDVFNWVFNFILSLPFIIPLVVGYAYRSGLAFCLLITLTFFLIWGFLFLVVRAIVDGITKN